MAHMSARWHVLAMVALGVLLTLVGTPVLATVVVVAALGACLLLVSLASGGDGVRSPSARATPPRPRAR